MLPKRVSNKFRSLAHLASNAERKKRYDLAAQYWNKALVYTEKEENIEWVLRRRDFCLTQNKFLK
ncbi:ANR family transcriptional regulator [Citrobacter freundii]|uniref:ANR family transcriptional regulator n=2 Tax=Citrobacter TaxID=544 RepID=UPI0039906EB1